MRMRTGCFFKSVTHPLERKTKVLRKKDKRTGEEACLGTRPLGLLPHSGGGLEEQELRGLPAPACLCPAYLLASSLPCKSLSPQTWTSGAWLGLTAAQVGGDGMGAGQLASVGAENKLAFHRSITTTHSSILLRNPTGSFLPRPTHWKSTVYVMPVLPLSWHQGRQLDQREGPTTHWLYGLKQAAQPLWALPAPSVCDRS